MKFNKKSLIKDLLIFIVPIVIIYILTPILPERISIHRGIVNRYINKEYAFVLGILPFVIYKLKYNKK